MSTRENLDNVVRHWAQWRPKQTCLVFDDQRWTWDSLNREVDGVAAGFQELGLKPGQRMGLLASNCVEWIVCAFAAMRIGVIVVPLNERLAAPEVERIIEDADCSAVIVDARQVEKIERHVERKTDTIVLSVEEVAEPWAKTLGSIVRRSTPNTHQASRDEVALIAYTSGTTGLPKGVMLTHGAILAQAYSRGIEYGWHYDTLRALQCVPLSVVGGVVTSLLLPFVSGGRVYLERDFDARKVLKLVEEERISTMIFVPTIWEELARLPEFDRADLSSVATAITGGAPVPIPLLELYQTKGVLIHQSYGLTEATSFVTDVPIELALSHNEAVGYPAMHTRVEILTEAGEISPRGDIGEIAVSGPTVMKGYWQNPDATAAALEDAWLRTGDLGKLDDNGLLYVVGRKKEMFISGGFNVYPAEVELAISALPGVLETCVFPIQDERWGEVGVAVVIAEPSAVHIEGLYQQCRDVLADFKVPKHLVARMDPLPRNPSGKVIRKEVLRWYQDAEIAPGIVDLRVD